MIRDPNLKYFPLIFVPPTNFPSLTKKSYFILILLLIYILQSYKHKHTHIKEQHQKQRFIKFSIYIS